MFRLLLSFCLLFLLACAPKVKSQSNQQVAIDRIKSKQLEHSERLVELERSITQIYARLEKLEFYLMERKDQLADKPPVARPEEYIIRKEPETELKVKKANTSTLVPLETLEQDRYVELDSFSQKAFNLALDQIQRNQFQSALVNLNEVHDLNFKHLNLPIILFWKAVCYEATAASKKAVSLYTEIVSNHPQHERAALALFRQSSLFVRIGEKELAKLTLEKILKDYPASDIAEQAKKKLNNL